MTTRLAPAELAAIGSVAQEWARLEGHVHILISGMIGGPLGRAGLVGPAMGSKLSFEFAAGLATAYFPAGKESARQAVAKFMQRAAKLAPRRNEVVHQIWVPGDKPGQVKSFGLKVRHEIKISAGSSSAQEFLELAKEIEGLAADLLQFLEEHSLFPAEMP